MLTLRCCNLRGCFFFGVVVLVLSVAMSNSFFHVAQPLEVKAHRMAISINPDGTPIEGYIYLKGGWYRAQFSTEDDEAYVWMNITLDKRTTITAQWRFPNSSIYLGDHKTPDEGQHYVWFSIRIKGYPPAQALGLWKVEVSAENNPLFTEEFGISQAPTFPWDTTLRITGVIVVVLAAPILLVFSKMKKRPRKSSFALSLVSGLMIAISGFFRGALGGEMSVYSIAIAMGIFFSGIVGALILGTVISISALTHGRVAVLILSVISLIYFIFIYYSLMQGADARLYVVPVALSITGSTLSMLSGILIRRKT